MLSNGELVKEKACLKKKSFLVWVEQWVVQKRSCFSLTSYIWWVVCSIQVDWSLSAMCISLGWCLVIFSWILHGPYARFQLVLVLGLLYFAKRNQNETNPERNETWTKRNQNETKTKRSETQTKRNGCLYPRPKTYEDPENYSGLWNTPQQLRLLRFAVRSSLKRNRHTIHTQLYM